jgi:hypothetical protein
MTDDTQKARLPKTSEFVAIGCLSALLTVPHVVPAGVAKLIVEAGFVELDDELDESLPPPLQATNRSESSAEILRR